MPKGQAWITVPCGSLIELICSALFLEAPNRSAVCLPVCSATADKQMRDFPGKPRLGTSAASRFHIRCLSPDQKDMCRSMMLFHGLAAGPVRASLQPVVASWSAQPPLVGYWDGAVVGHTDFPTIRAKAHVYMGMDKLVHLPGIKPSGRFAVFGWSPRRYARLGLWRQSLPSYKASSTPFQLFHLDIACLSSRDSVLVKEPLFFLMKFKMRFCTPSDLSSIAGKPPPCCSVEVL